MSKTFRRENERLPADRTTFCGASHVPHKVSKCAAVCRVGVRLFPFFSLCQFFSRYVHVYNASSEAMTVLQVLPAVMESARGVQLSIPLVGGGGGGNRDITIHDDKTIDRRHVPAWANASGGSGSEPPINPAKFETLTGMKAMRVVPYTVTGSRAEDNLKVFPRDFFHCSAGYDYYLLQKIIDGTLRPRFWEGDVGEDMSEERRVMDIVNR